MKTYLKIESFSCLLILLIFLIAILGFYNITSMVSYHNNMVNSFSSSNKWSFFFLPVASIFLYALLTFFQYNPEICSFPFQVHSKMKAYKLMKQFTWSIKNATIFVLLYIEYCMYSHFSGKVLIWVVLFLLVYVLLIVYYFLQFKKA